MPGFDGSLNFNTKIDQKGFNKGTKTMSGAIKKLGVAIVAAFSVRQIIKFGSAALKVASDLQEVANVVDVTFGEMADQIRVFASTAIETFGLSSLSAQKYASTFGSIAKGMNFTTQEAVDLSISLTGLIGDFASFRNLRADEAFTTLSAVFTGETESLKRHGIVITEVNLQQYLLDQGIERTIKSLTAQEKVVLRYNFVLDALRDSQGDFLRTQDSWANQTRILTERWKEFLGLVGDNLIQVLTPLLQVINQILASLISATRQYNAFMAGIRGEQVGEQDEITSSIDGSTGAQDGLNDSIDETNKKLKKSLAAFDEINVLNKQTSEDATGGALGLSIETIDTVLPDTFGESEDQLNAVTTILETIREKFNDISESAAIVFDSFDKSLGPAKKAFETDFAPALENFFETVTINASTFAESAGETFELVGSRFLKSVEKYNKDILPELVTFNAGFLDILSQLSTDVTESFTEMNEEIVRPLTNEFFDIVDESLGGIAIAWDDHSEAMLLSAETLYDDMESISDTFYNSILKPIVDNALDDINTSWTENFGEIIELTARSVLDIGESVGEIINVFTPLINFLIYALSPIFVGVFSLLTGVFGSFLESSVLLGEGLLLIFNGIIDFLIGPFTFDWERTWNGLFNIFGGIVQSIVSVFLFAINVIIDGINAVIDAYNALLPEFGGLELLKTQNIENITFPRFFDESVSDPEPVASVIIQQQQETQKRETDEQITNILDAFLVQQAESDKVIIELKGDLADFARIYTPVAQEEDERRGSDMKRDTNTSK